MYFSIYQFANLSWSLCILYKFILKYFQIMIPFRIWEKYLSMVENNRRKQSRTYLFNYLDCRLMGRNTTLCSTWLTTSQKNISPKSTGSKISCTDFIFQDTE
jgi:hypothetical protein